MSALLMGRVFYTTLPSRLKFLLLALADHANDEGEGVRVGQARLAVKIGATDRTVRSGLTTLREQGFIERTETAKGSGVGGQWGSPDHYRIIVSMLPTSDQIRDMMDAIRGPETSSGRSTKGPETQRQGTGNPASGDRKRASYKPSEEPPVKPSDKGDDQPSAPVEPEDRDEDLMAELPAPNPSTHQVYLMGRLIDHDDRWAKLTYGGIVKLNKQHGRQIVSDALGRCWEEAQAGIAPPKSPYPFFVAVCSTVASDRPAAS